MIKAIKVTNAEKIKTIIRQTFEGDDILFLKYHLINNDKAKAIAKTTEQILDSLKAESKYEFYVMVDEESDNEIGYFSGMVYGGLKVATSILHSFGLRVAYRKKENTIRLFELAKEVLGGASMTCLLFQKNTRAIKSCTLYGFEEMGAGILDENKEPYTILKLKIENASNDNRCSCRHCDNSGKCKSAIKEQASCG